MIKIFDGEESQALKEHGMQVAAEKRREALEFAREIAVIVALRKPSRETNADEVFKEIEDRGGDPNLGPAAGSLFKNGDWRFTGRRVLSRRTTNHRRELRVWEYIGMSTNV